MPAARWIRWSATVIAVSLVAAPLSGQRRKKPAPAPAPDTTSRLQTGDPALRALHWRLVGPYRGGRTVAVAGDPAKPLVFYFGAVDGGVWKTANGGQTWRNITDGRSDIASVGALAVAPSDPNVLYVGSGEADWREDLTYGDGMWRSTDGGRTWQHLGLEDARHIAAVRVDPRDPDLVYVAAMGHAFGPNATRGVFRSQDGGKTWKKLLFVDDSTGAIDLGVDPANPRILYAALWKAQRFPWGFAAGGGKSGLWKTSDGGETWTDISGSDGLPLRPLGRIGITVSPANPSRLWASVEAPDSGGGIFRSEDAGKTWERVNAEQKFMIRPWYFSSVTADPVDQNTVYVLNLATWRSIDGGKTFERLRVPHGDCHILWIDPLDPKRMVEGNDGGATVSFDAGETWSTVYNQPTAQFYHVITDDQFPYRIYGAQQDNSTVSIASRSDEGAITERDWWPVGGGESGYIAPQPGDPSVAFAGTYMGTLTRYDRRSGQTQDVSVWLNNYDGHAASDVPYRFQWTFPIVFSPHERNTLYTTAHQVFKTTDGGASWHAISPDLTVHDPATLGPSGGPITRDMTGTEWYATIFAFAESPVKAGVLWAGSDDGLVHVSRDGGGGASWQNVTPKDLGRFTRVSIIEPSHFDAGAAYLAANRYQQDDFQPYLFKTTDYGRSWTKITSGVPAGAYTRSIREDPVRRGLLFAGTETGIYYSLDDGAHWQSLQLNLPRASVRDITIHGGDLIVATHGRAFWVLDDISILRQLTDQVRGESAHLFTPEPAVRFAGGRSSERSNAGENPWPGLAVDYYLKEKPQGDVTLAFLDSAGTVIRTFSSKTDTTKRAAVEDSATYAPSDSIVPVRAGTNRFVWNLRSPDADKVKDVVVDEGMVEGPVALPGRYTVKLTVAGKSYSQPFTVVEDPRITVPPADLAANHALALRIRDRIDTLSAAVTRIERDRNQLTDWVEWTKQQPYATRVKGAADSLKAKLEAVRDKLTEPHAHADEATLHWPIQIYNQLLSLNAMVQSADAAPTKQEQQASDELSRRLDEQLAKLKEIEGTDVAAFNELLRTLNVPAVGAGARSVAGQATEKR